MSRSPSIQLALLLAVFFIAAMAWATWDTMKRSGAMALRGTHGAAIVITRARATAGLIIEVLSVGNDGQIKGRLLEEYGGSYRPTPVPVMAQLTTHTAIVMGTAADIKPRAVLDLSGRVDDHHHFSVARVIVLTDYVTVAR